ncbi:hypothetical protein Hte_008873 [Hypoxylon texense]
MTHRNALVGSSSGEYHLVEGIETPEPKPGMMLCKVAAVALNPIDARASDYSPAPGAIGGHDFSGEVIMVGAGVKRFKKGDKIFAFTFGLNQDDKTLGAFADYAFAVEDLACKIPTAMTFEEASTLGLGIGTAAFSLYRSLGLPTPNFPVKEQSYVLIAGGATSSGIIATQLLRASGFKPIVTCSPHNTGLMRSYGAIETFDYHSDACGGDIRQYTDDTLECVLDCVATSETMRMCYHAIGAGGGRYIALDPPATQVKYTRRDVYADWVMALSLFGGPVRFSGIYMRPASPVDREFAADFYPLAERLIAEGILRPPPIKAGPHQRANGAGKPDPRIMAKLLQLDFTDFFNFEWLRVLGMAPYHGADVAECFEAASKIKRNDPESWHKSWQEAADDAEAAGDQALLSGDREAARWAFLRSSNYRRASQYMLHHLHGDPRLLGILEKSISTFRRAILLFDSPVEVLEVPYEKSQLPAYLYLPISPPPKGQKSPVIVQTSGFDSTQEEMYYFTAAGARGRGYATLTFDGPGQGIVLLRDGLHMRPDWEVVIAAVLDQLVHWAEEHPDWNLDTSRIAVVGCSMGGYFALRAAASDPRIAACVSSDGFYDFGVAVRARTPWFWRYLSDGVADFLLDLAARYHFQTRWEFGHCALTFGTGASLSAGMRELQRYTLEHELDGRKGSVLSKVKCPVLVTGARDSIYDPIGTDRIYEGLTQLVDNHTKVLWEPIGIGHGSLQAKIATISSLNNEVFGFLDRIFNMKRT